MATDYDWIKDLKAGDKVFVTRGSHIRLVTVDRVTATQIVIGGERFRKSDGYRMGDSNTYWFTTLKEHSQEKEDEFRAQVKHEANIKRLKNCNFAMLSPEVVAAIVTLLPEDEK